jgi:ABC-type nitrate/sulfonate/bicarbonate transport system permease component
VEVRRVSGGQRVLELVGTEHLPQGSPWVSSHGYQVTDDWWILGPDGKRLLMLPPLWQSWSAVQRVWKGRFLALLHANVLSIETGVQAVVETTERSIQFIPVIPPFSGCPLAPL